MGYAFSLEDYLYRIIRNERGHLIVILLIHVLVTFARLQGPGGERAFTAHSLLMKQQLLVINRSQKGSPNLSVIDRFLVGFWSLFPRPCHIRRSRVILKLSTLLRCHDALRKRKPALINSLAEA